jgi:hypothetical protein
MQCQIIDNQVIELAQEPFNEALTLEEIVSTEEVLETQAVHFQTHFEGYMEMYSDAETVAAYLNAHEGWFCRCAQPMKVEPIGDNGYILTVGKFGSFGYEVEPKLAVVLQPPQDRIYQMHSIPIPNYFSPGYEVDYQASMELVEVPIHQAESSVASVFKKKGQGQLPSVITKVRWHLKMDVAVQFPKFIYKLPLSMIQSTGDRLLAQIVRQISPRLTHKVQQDFHIGQNLPQPPKNASYFQKVSQESEDRL